MWIKFLKGNNLALYLLFYFEYRKKIVENGMSHLTNLYFYKVFSSQ